MSKINSKFSASQKDFYSAAQTAWRNFLLFLINFSNHKAFYKAGTATTALAALKAANDMPDAKQRQELAEETRVDMLKLADDAVGFFVNLKTYIDSAYEEDKREIKYEAAGQHYYTGSQKEDWESVIQLGTRMTKFIGDNSTKLKEGDNMPETFEDLVKEGVGNFNKAYEDYKVYSETGDATQNKIKALNHCYDTMMQMMKDGKAIFRKDATKQEYFNFSSILATINQTKAGITGLVTDAATDIVIKNAKLSIKYANEPAIIVNVNDDGTFDKEVKGGDAIIIIMAPDYAEHTESVTINTGSTLRLNVKLQKAA